MVNGAELWADAVEMPDWRHVWLDLAAYRGQSVTLAFSTRARPAAA